MKYRKKPIEVDAWHVSNLITFAAEGWGDLPDEVGDAYERGDIVFMSHHLLVRTLEGTMRAEHDDMLVRGAVGEFYPVKAAAFAASFEPLPDKVAGPGSDPTEPVVDLMAALEKSVADAKEKRRAR